MRFEYSIVKASTKTVNMRINTEVTLFPLSFSFFFRTLSISPFSSNFLGTTFNAELKGGGFGNVGQCNLRICAPYYLRAMSICPKKHRQFDLFALSNTQSTRGIWQRLESYDSFG
jgi:hypothetical protein